jgi:Bacterial Ig domain/Bacterial Ig-like domain
LARISLTFGAVTRTTTADASGAWSLSFVSSQIPDDSDYTLTATQTDLAGNVSAEASRRIKVDAQPPAKPVITIVASDDIINGNEKLAGVSVRGTAEPSATVEVVWGSVTRTARVGTNGAWSVSFTGAQVPADGPATIRARATDSTGNVSEDTTRTVSIDTLSQTPTIDVISTDNIVNAAEKAAGVTITGTAESGANVSVTIAGVSKSAITTTTGIWSVNFAAADLPADASGLAVTVQSTDVAGNLSAVTTRLIDLDTAAPARPTIAVVSGDDAINANEQTAAVSVQGTGVAGSQITVTWGGVTRTTTADADGRWTVVYSVAQIPSDGVVEMTATARDLAGNISAIDRRNITIDTSTAVPTVIPCRAWMAMQVCPARSRSPARRPLR